MPRPKKIGRPPLAPKERKSKGYFIRFRPDDERAVLSAAQASGKATIDWIRDTLLKAARGT